MENTKAKVDLTKDIFFAPHQGVAKAPLSFQNSKLMFPYLLPKSIIIGIFVHALCLVLQLLLVDALLNKSSVFSGGA
jgi:hypothetical protein